MEEKKKSAGSRKAVLVATLGLACGAAVVMAVAARRPMPSSDVAPTDSQPAAVETGAAATTATDAPTQATSTNAASATKTPAIKKTAAKAAKTPSSAKLALEEPELKGATPEAFAAMPAAAADEAPARPALTLVQTDAVTINGCLERDGNSFRLKDVDGVDAPKARSWKSGFLKRGAPKISVVDATNRLKLTDHVGQRVSVTGQLEDREMQARSVSRVSTFCE